MTSQKIWNLKKKNEISKKKNENKIFSELDQCQCQTMSVLGNVMIQLMSESDNVKVKQAVQKVSYFNNDTVFTIKKNKLFII